MTQPYFKMLMVLPTGEPNNGMKIVEFVTNQQLEEDIIRMTYSSSIRRSCWDEKKLSII